MLDGQGPLAGVIAKVDRPPRVPGQRRPPLLIKQVHENAREHHADSGSASHSSRGFDGEHRAPREPGMGDDHRDKES
jgi:hypothetical protein